MSEKPKADSLESSLYLVDINNLSVDGFEIERVYDSGPELHSSRVDYAYLKLTAPDSSVRYAMIIYNGGNHQIIEVDVNYPDEKSFTLAIEQRRLHLKEEDGLERAGGK